MYCVILSYFYLTLLSDPRKSSYSNAAANGEPNELKLKLKPIRLFAHRVFPHDSNV